MIMGASAVYQREMHKLSAEIAIKLICYKIKVKAAPRESWLTAHEGKSIS